ncbi:hypothetical protein TNIN_458991 [Trichonephila inaurata madagascariensis]|uniref:Uncharacterized protein n=1 Tax=Trichonephila inaurata madagascariensis TaxID=2747483 RepID=A0A8X6XY14_9ARAC|nr:hypothetical protein TNIN_2271 [Trichonephila inaurata madagascariensis]GFY62411.1 hypothetical protein TNIN_458991 [Trichonephila inaurata madagascariensis]
MRSAEEGGVGKIVHTVSQREEYNSISRIHRCGLLLPAICRTPSSAQHNDPDLYSFGQVVGMVDIGLLINRNCFPV